MQKQVLMHFCFIKLHEKYQSRETVPLSSVVEPEQLIAIPLPNIAKVSVPIPDPNPEPDPVSNTKN
jgi:hypothetical protein